MTDLTPQAILPEEAEVAESTPEVALPGEEAPTVESTPEGVLPGAEAGAAEAAAAMPSEAPPREALASPSVPPPGLEEAPGVGWHSGKKITALWSLDENRNSWIGVHGVGWKKLANNSDSAVVALTMLAAHAKLTGGNVDIKEDAEQITEIYAW